MPSPAQEQDVALGRERVIMLGLSMYSLCLPGLIGAPLSIPVMSCVRQEESGRVVTSVQVCAQHGE